jgi:hypothetical protein
MATVQISVGGDSINLVIGATGLASQLSVPLSNLQAFDLVAQAGVVAGGVASDLNPAFAFPAFLISEVASITGSALVTIYAPGAEQAANSGALNLPSELEFAGEAVSVLGDLFGMVSAAGFAIPTLKISASVGSIIFTTAGVAITSLQIGPTLLNIAENTITNVVSGVESKLSSSEAATANILGTAWSQSEAALVNALTQVSNLISALVSNNNQQFISDVSAVSNAISNASSALLSQFGVQAAAEAGFTENGSNGSTTIINGAVTTTGTISQNDSGLDSSGSLVGADPFTLTNANTISSSGQSNLSFEGNSGTIATSNSVSIDGTTTTFDDLMYNGITISTAGSDSAEILIAPDDLPYVDVSAPNPSNDIQIDTRSDGSGQILLGENSGNSAQELLSFSSGSLLGDTISIIDSSAGSVDLAFHIENGGTLNIVADSNIGGVSQDFDFSGSSGVLAIDGAGSFTVYGAVTGDYIELDSFTSGQIVQFANANDPDFILLNSITGALTTIALPDYTGGPFELGNLLQNGNLTIEIMRSSVACFVAGTRILTPRGEIAVEDLKEGDAVITESGQNQPIKWIGKRRLDLSRHPAPETAQPIRFEADCFANDIPTRDLFLSPDHALFIDGILVPAKVLLNGKNVSQPAASSVTYYHLELEDHSVIFAENTPAETYLETGNRGAFENGADTITLHPEFAHTERAAKGCAPLMESGPQVETIRARLLERANIQTTQDPALVVEYGNGNAVIRSRYAVPGLITPDPRDRRRLGVKVASIIVGGRHISFDHPALTEGWHDCESDGRWTNGSGVIPAELLAGACDVSIIIAATVPYPVAA